MAESSGSLKPGRELDALVAEKVMGWHPAGTRPGWGVPHDRPLELREVREVPSYSSNIADAWKVVRRFEEMNQRLWIERDIGLKKWICLLDGIAGGVAAPTFPEAVCLAALKAVGA